MDTEIESHKSDLDYCVRKGFAKHKWKRKSYLDLTQTGLSENTFRKKRCCQIEVSEKFIMSSKGNFRRRFDIIVLILALWNAVLIPIEYVYDFDFLKYTSTKIIDNFIDVIFFVDMILMFFTSFFNSKGEEIFDSMEIAHNYVIKPRFYMDALSLFGTGFVSKFLPEWLKSFGYFKLSRIKRIH